MRYVPKKNGRTSGQRWKTFLKNHVSEIVSIDFLTVETINFKLLHVLVFLSHGRRKIIHFNVTAHPTSEWSTQQLRNALHDSETPKFLIRDRDTKFGNLFSQSVSDFDIHEIVTAFRSPWQNGYVERVIGSILREFLDHLIVICESHLRKLQKNIFITIIISERILASERILLNLDQFKLLVILRKSPLQMGFKITTSGMLPK